MKLKCDKCGELEYALLDGYGFGDRVLEGVGFIVRVVKGHLRTKEVEDASKKYFETLNGKKWLKEANLSLEDIEEDNDDLLRCPNNDGHHSVALCNDDGTEIVPADPVKPVTVVKTSNLADLLKRFGK